MKFRALCDACESAEGRVWCKEEARALCTRCSHSIHESARPYLHGKGQRSISANPHELVDIVRGSVLSPICARCVAAPALVHCHTHGACVCETCVGEMQEIEKKDTKIVNLGDKNEEVVARMEMDDGDYVKADRKSLTEEHLMVGLKETRIGDSFVFDKMDFSAAYLRPESKSASCTEGAVKKLDQSQSSAEAKVTKWLASSATFAGSLPVMRSAPVDLSYFQTTIPSTGNAGPSRTFQR